MKLTAKGISLLAQQALVLEPLADKPDCTTRYIDLPGRPLEDFVLAGIKVGSIFEQFANDHISGTDTRLFHRFVDALMQSKNEGGKYVNFGLLEILFPTVAARIICDDPDRVIPTIIEQMKQAPHSDVEQLVNARKLAWSTSEKREVKLADLTPEVCAAPSPYAFYEKVAVREAHGAITQWVDNYQRGLPLLSEQFLSLRSQTTGSVLTKIKDAYTKVREQDSGVRVGILADMSAAAIFLYLSFAEQVND